MKVCEFKIFVDADVDELKRILQRSGYKVEIDKQETLLGGNIHNVVVKSE